MSELQVRILNQVSFAYTETHCCYSYKFQEILRTNLEDNILDFEFLYFACMGVLSASLSVHLLSIVPEETRRAHWTPGIGVPDDCELPMWTLEMEPESFGVVGRSLVCSGCSDPK